MDRRIKYTKMVLNDSLIQFLEQKELSKITVTELCKAADVNRSTYYAHFTDPFQQMSKLKEELITNVTAFTRQIDISDIPLQNRHYYVLKSILAYVEKKRHTFRILLSENGDRKMQEELLHILAEKAFAPELMHYADETTRHYWMIYAANGCFGMFFQWLIDENPIPSEQLAQIMADFTTR